MTKKSRKRFSQEVKDKAIDEYLIGDRSAQQITDELRTDVQNLYRWKTVREEKAKGQRVDELMGEGNSRAMVEKLLEKELEIEMYQKKVAEQAIIIDLLKKLQTPSSSQPESELTGLIKTSRKSAQKRKPVK